MFRKMLSVALVALAVCFGFFAANGCAQAPAGTVMISVRDVSVIPEGDVKRPLKAGDEINEGDLIVTGRGSYVRVELANGTQVKIGEKAKYSVNSVEDTRVDIGSVWASIFKGTKFNLRTPTVVASVRGTELSISVAEDGLTDVIVFAGMVEVSNEYGRVEISQEAPEEGKPQTEAKKVTVAAGVAPPTAPLPVSVKEIIQVRAQLEVLMTQEEKVVAKEEMEILKEAMEVEEEAMEVEEEAMEEPTVVE